MAFTDDDHIYSSPAKTSTTVPATDPLAGLDDLAKQVHGAGIRRVAGEVLIDARLFEQARGSGSGPDIVTPILVNDNVVDVVVRPGAKVGAASSYTLRPATSFVQTDVQVQTVSNAVGTRIATERVGPGRFAVRGTIAVGAGPQVRICIVDDPVGFARALFIERLRAQGVEVAASPLKAPNAELPPRDGYDKLSRVALHHSLPLSEAIKVTLKVSHNLYASTLPLLVTGKQEGRTLREGMRREGRILADLGVDVKTISLESGAGGGDGDKVSPRATVQLLQGLRKRADWPVFEAALPILGVDGTLTEAVGPTSTGAARFAARPARSPTPTYWSVAVIYAPNHWRER